MINPATAEAPAGGQTSAPAPQIPRTAQPSAPSTRGINGSAFRIRGDLVTAATAELPDRQREALRWLAGHCRAKNLDHKVVAAKLKKPDGESYSGDSVYHALTGGRTAEQLDNIVAAIERYRKLEEERAGVVRTGFIQTAISLRIFRICRKALRRRRVCFIWGETQTGKTTALDEYTRLHNHGETHLVRCPSTGGTFRDFLKLLAESLHVPVQNYSTGELREVIINAIDDHMLIIVDEMHEPFGPKGDRELGVVIVNFLREIYDRKKCGLVLCGTPVFRDAVLHGRFRRNLAQIWKRGLIPLSLPPVPGEKDLALFAQKFGLEPAPDAEVAVRVTTTDDDGRDRTRTLQRNLLELQRQVVAEQGLGRWITILEEASDLASEKRRAISWGLVLHAWHSFEQDASFEEASAAEGEEGQS